MDKIPTRKQALEALDDLDDYARMANIDPIGPRELLERFIKNAISESELAACREDGEWVGRVMQSNLGPDRNWSGLSDDEKDLWDACQRLRDAARAKEGGAK